MLGSEYEKKKVEIFLHLTPKKLFKKLAHFQIRINAMKKYFLVDYLTIILVSKFSCNYWKGAKVIYDFPTRNYCLSISVHSLTLINGVQDVVKFMEIRNLSYHLLPM